MHIGKETNVLTYKMKEHEEEIVIEKVYEEKRPWCDNRLKSKVCPPTYSTLSKKANRILGVIKKNI